MKYISLISISVLLLISCNRDTNISSISPINWERRAARLNNPDSLIYGSTYLSVYSEIYQLHEHKTFPLTVTVSLRNISPSDSIYILEADYFNTEGNLIRSYFNKPIYIKPLETIEIIIDETDREGGTGGNFIFDWALKTDKNVPLFEAVMISTTGQQGLSFLTRGVRISR